MEITNSPHLQSALDSTRSVTSSQGVSSDRITDSKKPVAPIKIQYEEFRREEEPVLYGELIRAQNNAAQSDSGQSSRQQTQQPIALISNNEPSDKAIRSYLEQSAQQETPSDALASMSIDIYA